MLDGSTDLKTDPTATARPAALITVYPNRVRFEAALRGILDHPHGPCALLHVAVVGESGTGSISRRMLNLVGSTLRVCMRRGDVAYLGDAEFSVLLRGADLHEAGVYARTVITIVRGFRVVWEGEVLSAEAHIGAVMFDDGEMNTQLLSLAEDAGRIAANKPGFKLHMLQDSYDATLLPAGAAGDTRIEGIQ